MHAAFLIVSLFVMAQPVGAAAIEMPRVMDDRLQLELVCENPDVVHPIGLTIDAKGRLLVIESHTHFPPKDYAGPPHDRILLIDPREKPAKPRIFYEGSKQTMSIARAPDDSIYVATRSEIFRLRDTDGDDQADERTRIAHLETAGNYPHNGLAGLAFPKHHGSRADELRFGFGENLGADYKLIGSDGTTLAGGGEGGNVYACQFDGSKLRRVATGFWNPFAMTFDPQGRLFAVDNDLDSRPPCRLLHVVEGGDYGFQFRHGRKGTHPFTAWNGELPGTLPMMCGTGEAPSALILDPYVDAVDRKQESWNRTWTLLGTSWGDHRIERFITSERGESFAGEMVPVVVGGENFRPVGMDSADDGAIYFTDWVDKSYTLHGKGRVWKLSHKKPEGQRHRTFVSLTKIPEKRSDAELLAAIQERWREVGDADARDPFYWNGKAHSLANLLRRGPPLNDESAATLLNDFAKDQNAPAVIWAAVAARNANVANARRLASRLLEHSDPRVRTLGVMWIGNDGLVDHRADVEKVLSQPGLTRELFECALAALELLDRVANPNALPQDNKRQTSGDVFALKALRNAQAAPTLRRFALKSLPPSHPELTVDLLRKLADDADAAMRVEAIRSLRERSEPEARTWLRAAAVDERRATADRIEATIGLRPDDTADRAVLDLLVRATPVEIGDEARRLLRSPVAIDRPIDKLSASLMFDGKAERGERLFFHPRIAACFRCHEHSGRGAVIGPDLTAFQGRNVDRSYSAARLLTSILYPSHEIGPSYVPWLIETTDGRTLTGLYVGEEINGEHRYADPTGKIFKLHPNQIERREAAKQSIMPDDLAKTLTDDEIRDLIAFLLRQ